jgi:hypothetical protein
MAKPMHILEVWRDNEDKGLNFSQVETRTYGECREWFDYHLTLNGNAATVYVFYSDHDITKSEIIETATKFMKGDYMRIDIDLNKCIATKSKGVDKTNPRQ